MLDSFFFDTAARDPDGPALWVDERAYSYGEVASRACGIATALSSVLPAGRARRCLLFAHRSVAAYAGLLGILKAGCAYVPLNPNMPAARIAAVIGKSGAPVMLVDRRCAALLDEVVSRLDESPKIFLLDDAGIEVKKLSPGSGNALPGCEAWASGGLRRLPDEPGETGAANPRAPHDQAYILFTSGSTGAPKGVPISHENACAYVAGQLGLIGSLPGARYVQLCELSFDPSVHDMFVCWANGACLYVPKTVEPIYNAAFIKEHAITHWSSVPSVAAFMQQFRKLQPDEFPSLRVTLFGGEPLPRLLVQAWQRAAPNSRVLNMYGPTEATVACAAFEVTAKFLAGPGHAVMPLGRALPGMALLIVDAALEPVAPGECGELLIGGPQVAAGYLSADDPGNRRFISKRYPGCSPSRWYRSADAAREVAGHGIVFQGRLDTQIKIRGNRIELEEVEHVVRSSSQAALCAVIAWPVDESGHAAGLIAFVTHAQGGAARILHACRQRLPAYAVPQRVVMLDTLPLNVNGKVDRRALAEHCVTGGMLS
ncbi:amino acid adenylation domain-containing protein [Paraburkholderia aromaticivorans]|uniref:D-alanine--poly(Phosphoribitol) ligase n=1 Tax=Paraburkholderia aromaticivorans TaxID=2026199 RepID=A0A248VJP4_9BURK|nr:amino acid adenylation domain-containing protein [Paraburkholderia aromaticivorans]ASV99208.1 D-alanine--poly(phosphoribitol) ligase [Paraburkholderia aromaticivorans]